jgi:hypothetical protein
MYTFSPTCTRLTAAALDALPPAFRHRSDEPTHWGVREVLWACWGAAVRRLLDGSAWPAEVPVGRDGVVLAVPPTVWEEFAAELGLNQSAARDRTAFLLRGQLRPSDVTPEPTSPRDALPVHLLGLVVVTCWLDQLNRDGGGELRFPPRVIGRTVARHPSPAAFGAVDETAVHRAVTDYLRVQRGTDAASFRPLQQWLLAQAGSAPPPVMLSIGLFDEPPPPPAVHPPPPPVRPPEGRTLSVATIAHLLDVLTEVLEPALWSEKSLLYRGRASAAVTKQVAQAVAQLLTRDGVEVYGEPGETVTLNLPQVGWRLDDRLPPLPGADGPRAYRVNRRGLLVSGRVILPALVAPQEAADD